MDIHPLSNAIIKIAETAIFDYISLYSYITNHHKHIFGEIHRLELFEIWILPHIVYRKSYADDVTCAIWIILN